MIKAAVAGAGGYAGAELVRMLSGHKNVELIKLFVSCNSADLGRSIDELYGSLDGRCSLKLEGLSAENAAEFKGCFDVIFFATDHRVSLELAPVFVGLGITVIDLSGAYRLSDPAMTEKYYGFRPEGEQLELLQRRIYALTDIVDPEKIRNSDIISMPGCYTTLSELSLIPLCSRDLCDKNFPPVINAVSGVSGAGRKASLTSSFCEVSLNAYGLFNHRHRPEIEEYTGTKVIFNPHLGNFKRGILATITVKLKEGVSEDEVKQAYENSYPKVVAAADENLSCTVRLKNSPVKLQNVQNLPFCDIYVSCEDGFAVITSALDNLLKGAASQAVEAFNIKFSFPRCRGIL